MSESFRSILPERGGIRSVVLAAFLLGIAALPGFAQWTEPVMVDAYNDTAGVNTWGWDWCPFITADGSKMYLASDRGEGIDFDLYVSSWTGEEWTDPLRPPFCVEGNDERNPAANATNDTLYFISWAPGWDIFWVFRTGPCDTCWGTPERMPEPINSGAIEFSVSVTPDNQRLLFSSTRLGGMGGEDIYECRRDAQSETGWSAPARLPGLINTWRMDSYPTMGFDTTEIFFWRDDPYLYVARLTESGWVEGERLPETINRIVQNFPTETTPCISADGTRLYFASRYGNPPTVKDIWYSEREVSAPDGPRPGNRSGLQLNVYPNPAMDQLTVITTGGLTTLSITNLLGRTVSEIALIGQEQPYAHQFSLSAKGLSSGTYFLSGLSKQSRVTVIVRITK